MQDFSPDSAKISLAATQPIPQVAPEQATQKLLPEAVAANSDLNPGASVPVVNQKSRVASLKEGFENFFSGAAPQKSNPSKLSSQQQHEAEQPAPSSLAQEAPQKSPPLLPAKSPPIIPPSEQTVLFSSFLSADCVIV